MRQPSTAFGFKVINPCLGTVHILLGGARADTDTANNLAIDHHRQATTDRTDTPTHFGMNAESQLAGYVHGVVIVCRLFRR